MRTATEVVTLWRARKAKMGPVHAAGAMIRSVYNGEYPISLPELGENEMPMASNLILTGLDQHSMRIASTMPGIVCPPVRSSRSARARATDRKNTLLAWWYENRLFPTGHRYRARHLIGYATSPVYLRWGADGYPVWEIKDPLATFPAPAQRTDIVPSDCVFAMRMSLAELAARYGIERVAGLSQDGNDTVHDVLQYVDGEQITMVAVGKDVRVNNSTEASHVILSSVPNKTGRPLVVVPGRITLDRLQGQFDQMIGLYLGKAKLWALQLHAIQKGIFAETWMQFSDQMNGDYEQADPYENKIGEIHGGTITQFRPDPGFASLNAIDRLEAAERQTGAVPAEFGGEGASNVRTGRRGSQVMSATVDFPVQEHQEILAMSLQEENDIAIALAKAYAPNSPKTFHIPFLRGPVTCTPSVTFDSEAQFVNYAYAGADTNALVVEGGQRVGMGTLSKQSFMEIDPMVKDPDAEGDRIILEGLQLAALSAIQTQAQDPAGPWGPHQLARLEELVGDRNLPLYQAVLKVQEEVQAEQAQAQQGQMSPEQMQPGLMPAGAPGTPQAGAAIPPPGPSQGNLAQLLSQLRINTQGAQ